MDIERLILTHKDAVYRQMVRVCGNHDDAEDALAEAMLQALKFAQSLRDEDAFRGWLATIARRICGRLRNKERLTSLVDWAESEFPEPASNAPDPSEVTLALALKACVNRAVESLPDIYREVYLLRDIEGLDAEETCRRLNISLAAQKSRLHRAREKVRQAIDADLHYPVDLSEDGLLVDRPNSLASP